MTTPTDKDIPSNSVQDRLYNAEKFDEFMNSDNPNYTDRKGKSRWTVSGIRQAVLNWMSSLSSPSGASAIGTTAGTTVQSYIDDLIGTQGFSVVGSCDSVDQLRITEPKNDKSIVLLRKAVPAGPTLNSLIWYDSSDSTSSDNGVSVFVTPGGARWKADLSNGYDLRMAGILIDGSNFSQCFNKCVSAIIGTAVTNNRINNIVKTIKVKPTNFINEFTLTETLKMPSFVSVDFIGGPFLEAASLTDVDVVRICNCDFPTLTKEMFQAEAGPAGASTASNNQAIGRRAFGCSDGNRITLRGPGYGLNAAPPYEPTYTSVGVVIGNDVATTMDVRDIHLADINIIGFHTGIKWGGFYTFMCGVVDFNISKCWNAVEVPEAFSNFGERMFYHQGTLGNIGNYGFWIKGAGDFTLENVSTDFIGSDLVHFGSASPGEHKHLSGHIEGVQGYLVNKDTPTSYSKSLAYFGKIVRRDDRVLSITTSSGKILKDYRGVRPLFHCPSTSYGKMLKVIDGSYAPGREGATPYAEYCCMTGGPNDQGVELIPERDTFIDTPYINSYVDGIRKSVNRVISFTTSTGPLGIDPISTDYAFAAICSGSATCQYGSAADASSDGILPFVITLTSPTEVVDFYCTNQFRINAGYDALWATCSVKLGNATGNVTITPIMRNYLKTQAVFNASNNTVALNPILRNTSIGYPIDMTASLADSGKLSTEFFGMQPRQIPSGFYLGMDFSVAGFRITGYVGTIYLKLPVWYVK